MSEKGTITVEYFSDEQLINFHRKLLRLTAILELAARNRYQTDKFKDLIQVTGKYLEIVEDEYFQRHPEEKTRRAWQFLKFCENAIDRKNADEFGHIGREGNAIVTESIFVEYNTPEPDEKRVTIHRTFTDKPDEHIEAEYHMETGDELFAMLEIALNEFAENLPEVPQEK
jgi:hypothetical protein